MSFRNKNYFGYTFEVATTALVRGLQLLFTIIALATSAASIAKWDDEYTRMTVAVSVISFVYLVLAFTIHPFVNALTVLIAESVVTILWLTAFAMVADLWGPGGCNYGHDSFYLYYTFPKTACQAGKAAIAFAFLSWILFVVSLVLFIVFTFVPLTKISRGIFYTKVLTLGSIYHGHNAALVNDATPSSAVAASGDLEARDLSSEPKEAYTLTATEPAVAATEPEVLPEHDVTEPVEDPLQAGAKI
jgi:hypothetical protein